MKLESLLKNRMYSGHLCLNLTSVIDWEGFPYFVQQLLGKIGGEIIDKNDAADIRVWKIHFDHSDLNLSLVWDDFPGMVSIEASDHYGDEKINEIYQQLSDYK